MYICKQETATFHSLSLHKTQKHQETWKQQHKVKMNVGRNILHRRKKNPAKQTTQSCSKDILTKHNQNCSNQGRFRLKWSCCWCSLTVNRTKNLWFFSPTQLFTHGQWWSIFRMHRLQILEEKTKGFCWEIGFEILNVGTRAASGHRMMWWNISWPTAHRDFICISLQKLFVPSHKSAFGCSKPDCVHKIFLTIKHNHCRAKSSSKARTSDNCGSERAKLHLSLDSVLLKPFPFWRSFLDKVRIWSLQAFTL